MPKLILREKYTSKLKKDFMIVRMKQVTIMLADKNIEEALKKLRRLGVVHIKHILPPTANEISSLEESIEKIDKAMAIAGLKKKELLEKEVICSQEEVLKYAEEIISLSQQREKILIKEGQLEEKIAWFKKWGNIDPHSIKELASQGVFVKFYICFKHLLKGIPKDKSINIIREEGNDIYLVLITDCKEEKLELKEVEIPEEGIIYYQRELEETKEVLKRTEDRIKNLTFYKSVFLNYRKNLIKELEFYKVRYGMAKEEGFLYLQGFCPQESCKSLEELAKKENWAVLLEEPKEQEEVPTLLRNPRWIEIIHPVFKLIGTLPGYREYDVSFWFLLFFSIFFAMLIGDAGYGIIFLLGTLFAQRKFKKFPKEIFRLAYILSIFTIIWGLITGTWFGWEKIARLPFLNYFVIDRINSFVEDNQSFIMYISFIIGLIQLSLAHSIVAFRYINSLFALAQIGWIFILWSVFFIAGYLILDKPLLPIVKILLIVGSGLVAVFSRFQKNILKGILLTISDLPLKVISCFSDLVSYARLFAVGYASTLVAATFNSIAQEIGFNSLISGFISSLILFCGHTLNIVLGLLSVIVHGIRLNILEFSSHLDMQWTGKAYQPFRE
ncbi:MAG: hypothetical protein NC817_00985 [Candidatus Omnitrophica bacterium]|nr:hypothetical protein [Candidatus Omnitrophota bacterium]MCM8823091.1 hypothetical protein [Candidatus Omnitrophota bacterium]MCM8825935.1 hypothetical protein [Candidatus Omnitrophota bacterium]